MKKTEPSQFLATLIASVIVSCIISFFLLTNDNFSPFGLTTYSQNAVPTTESTISDYEKELYQTLYDVNFIMQKNPSGNINVYIPKITPTPLKTAELYAEQFAINQNLQEDDEFYQFQNETGTLRIHKYNAALFFKSSQQSLTTETFNFVLAPDEQAIEIAENFIQSKLPGFTYEEAIVLKNYNSYQIQFLNRLDNLKNYAFPTQVTLDQFGNIIELHYYYPTYDKLASSHIQSMSEAFYNLPIDLPEDTTVDLKRCTLVYHYENSIIQPAYLFEGEISGDRTFQCFVNATVFRQ